jgi:hypothetical protein
MGHRCQVLEIIGLDTLAAFEPCGNFKSRRRPLDFFVPGLKLSGYSTFIRHAFLDDYPVDLAKKVRVPNRSAILTVGDALKADILLHLDDIANATIFDLPQRSSRQFATLPTFASLQEFLRAQQATDVVGAKGRFLDISHPFLSCILFCDHRRAM